MTATSSAAAFACWLAEQADKAEDGETVDDTDTIRALLVRFCQTEAFKSDYEIYPEKSK